MVTEEQSAQSDHLQKSALFLVMKVFLPAVEVFSEAYDQLEAVEVLVVVLVSFVDVMEHLQ